jgi:hypothetical protein
MQPWRVALIKLGMVSRTWLLPWSEVKVDKCLKVDGGVRGQPSASPGNMRASGRSPLVGDLPPSEGKGRTFESYRVRQISQ